MDMHELTRELHHKNDSKIVMVVADGLGGLPMQPGGLTELETAQTPNLDALAARGVLGSSIPGQAGHRAGQRAGASGPVRLRSAQVSSSAAGRSKPPASASSSESTTWPIRGNFCTLDAQGRITDRRAGRIASEESEPLAIRLREVKIPGVEVFVEPVKEHRFVVVLRAAGLGGDVHDTDPQTTGVPPLDPQAAKPGSERDSRGGRTVHRAGPQALAAEKKANGVTLRGFSTKPALPTYEEVYGLRAAAIAVYPMYKGLARLVGM